MAETVQTNQHYYTKEFGRFDSSEDNFVANQELTLEITLNEYRDLIKKQATAKQEIDEARSDKWSAQRERDNLKEENSELKSEIYSLQNSLKPVTDVEEGIND